MKKVLGIVVMVCIAGGILLIVLMTNNNSDRFSNVVPDRVITMEELSKASGLEGARCWVAVDGVVYDIHGFVQWVMGRHVPSGGKATCGKDLSKVILESPHGKKVLQELDPVGTLATSSAAF